MFWKEDLLFGPDSLSRVLLIGTFTAVRSLGFSPDCLKTSFSNSAY